MFAVNSIVTTLLTNGVDFSLEVEDKIIYLTLKTEDVGIVHSILSMLNVSSNDYSEAQNVNGNTEYIFYM